MVRFAGLPVARADNVRAMAATKRKKGTAKAARTSARRPTPRAKPAPKKKTKRATKPRSAKRAKSTKGTKKASEHHLICGAHGETPATFVCRHVADGVACGFHANPPAPDDPWPDAWCDLCEEAFQRGGGEWNEQNEGATDIKVLCTHCYEAARERNSKIPRLARGHAARLTEKEASRLIHRAVHAAQALQEKSDKKWRWQSMGRWDFDGEAGTLTFSDRSRATVVADIQLVGSYSKRSNTFQWAWETLGEDDSDAEVIARLRVFGEVRGIDQLTTPNWECDETTGWEMTALAAHVLGASGVYLAPMKRHLYWFMLLSNWRIATN